MKFSHLTTKAQKTYYVFGLLVSLILITFGSKILFDPKHSFSLYRSIMFGYSPIVFGSLLLLLRIKHKIIIINCCLFFVFGIVILEFSLIKWEKKLPANKYSFSTYEPHIGCGGINSNSPAQIDKYVDNTKIYPLSGQSHNLVSAENITTKKITEDYTDNHGFKNPFDWDSKTSVDYIFIGDSFTYGADVAHEEAFADLFRNRFPLTINLGCGTTGSITQYGIFLEYAKILKPKYVIWSFYSGNDLNGEIPQELNSFYSNYLKENFTQNLISRQKIIDDFYDSFLPDLIKSLQNKKTETRKFNKYKDFYKLKKIRIRFGLQHSFQQNSFETFKKIIINVHQDVELWGGKFIFIFIPTANKYTNYFHKLDHDNYYIHLINFLKNNSIEHINLDDELNKYDNPKKFYSGHLNIEGNKLLVKLIINKIVDIQH